jgi:hypothetical protein
MSPESVLHAEKEAIISHKVWQRNYSVDLSTEGEDNSGEGHTCYTDGSLKEGHAGAGVAIFDPDKHCSQVPGHKVLSVSGRNQSY